MERSPGDEGTTKLSPRAASGYSGFLGRDHALAQMEPWWRGFDEAVSNAPFLAGCHRIEKAADDERNFVKKGVIWALREVTNAKVVGKVGREAKYVSATPAAC